MAGPARRWIVAVLVLAAIGSGLVALAVYLLAQPLGRADQLSSVIAGIAGLTSLAGSVTGLLISRVRTGPAGSRLVRVQTARGVLRVRPELIGFVGAQARAAQALPYRVTGFGAVPIAAALYVRQDLEAYTDTSTTSGVEPELWERLEARSAGQVQVRMLPLAERVEQVLARHRHLLVEGGPGLGKSSLARSLTVQAAQLWLSRSVGAVSDVASVPVLVSARALARRRDQPWTMALAGACGDELGLHADTGVGAELFTDLPPGVCWLVFVDGLDEVTEPQRRDLLEVLAQRMAVPDSPYRMVILTRPLDSQARNRLRVLDTGVYTILPFSQTALEDFVAGVFAGADGMADRFLEQLRSADLEEVAATPLLATIAVTVFAADPDRGLPGNRYELYELYIAHLRETSAQRRRQLRARLRQRTADVPGGTQQVDQLFDQCGALVEHLAVAQVDTNDSLIHTAGLWCDAHGLLAGSMLAGRDQLIADVLASTGLLVRRERDLTFIHHTFAEHFTADRHAAALPATFDHTAHDWRTWIDRAVSRDDAAVAVLVRWTRRNPSPALLDWLQSSSRNYQFLAVTLLGGGASADDRHFLAALTFLTQVWSTYVNDDDLASRLRRLPNTTVVRSWALHVVQDDDAQPGLLAAAARRLASDPESARRTATVLHQRLTKDPLPTQRVALAAALSLVAPEQTHQAITTLTTALLDQLATASDRAAAARALMDLGPTHRLPTRDALHAAVASAELNAVDRAAVARVLAELDDRYRDQASAVVRAALNDAHTGRGDQLMLARLLAELGTDVASAASTLLGIAADIYTDPLDRIAAARLVADLSQGHRQAAATLMHQLATDPQLDAWDHRMAIQRLAELGVAHQLPVAAAARHFLRGDSYVFAPIWEVRGVAETLLRLPDPHRVEALAILGKTPQHLPDTHNIMIAVARAVLDPSYLPQATALLQAVATDRFAAPNTRHEAACMLAAVGTDAAATTARSTLLELARNGRNVWQGAYAAYWLAIEYPQLQTDAEPSIRRGLADPRLSMEDRLTSARFAVAVTELRHQGIRHLHAVVRAGAIDTINIPVLDQLASASRADHELMLNSLNAVAGDATLPASKRAAVCAALLERRSQDRRRAAEILAALSRDSHVTAEAKTACAEQLGRTPAGRAQAVAVLTLLCGDPHTPHTARLAANSALDRLDPNSRPARLDIARRLLADPTADASTRVQAVQWLVKVASANRPDPDHLVAVAKSVSDTSVLQTLSRTARRCGIDETNAVTSALRERLVGEDLTAAETCAVALALGVLGPENQATATAALSHTVTDERLCPADIVTVAEASSELTTNGRRAAAVALQRLLNRTDVELGVQVSAARCLGGIAASAPAAAAAAGQILNDLRATPNQMRQLTEVVLDHDPADALALARLTDLLQDPSVAPEERRAAAYALAAAIPERFADATIDRLAPVVGDHGIAASLAARLDDRYAADAADVLSALAIAAPDGEARPAPCADAKPNPLNHPVGAGHGWAVRWPAVLALTDLPQARERAASILAGMLTEPALTIRDRCLIAERLAGLGPTARDDAAARLLHLMTNPRLPARHRRRIAVTLASLSPVYRDIAATHLAAAASNPDPSREHLRAAADLATLSPAYHRQAIDVLNDLLDRPGISPANRLHTAAQLAAVSPADRATAATALTALTRTPGPLALRAADVLIRNRLPGWQAAAARLRDWPHRPIHLHRQAAATLLHAGPAQERAALADLAELCADPATPPHDRLEAALTVASRAPNIHIAVHTFKTLASTAAAPPTVRRRAAAALPVHDAATLTAAATVLRKLHADPHIAAEIRAHAAADLGRLGGRRMHDEAVALLTTHLTRDGEHLRRAASRHLACLGSHLRDWVLVHSGTALHHIDRLP